MSRRSTLRNGLFRLYERYVGDPDSPKDVYGYWVFMLGFILGVIGFTTFIVTYAGDPEAYGIIRISGTIGATALTLVMFGFALMLPIHRRGVYASVLGLLVALVGVVSFGLAYPENWRGFGEDYSIPVISVYAGGIGLIALVTALVPVVTGQKGRFVSQQSSEEPPILLGDALEGAQFAVFRDENGDWTWNVIHLDALGSSENSSVSRPDAQAAIDVVKGKIGGAGLMEITTSIFRLYENEHGMWRWMLLRDDGSALAESADEFADRDGVDESVSFMKDRAPEADIIEIEGAAFNFYESRDRWHWQLLDEDRTPVAKSAIGASSKSDAETDARSFTQRFDDARTLVVDDFGVELRERDGQWHWRFIDGDDTELAESVDSFERRREAEDAVEELLTHVPSASVTVAGEPTYELYEDDGTWQWRLVDVGEHVVATNPWPLDSQEDGEAQTDLFASNAADADVVDIDGAVYETYPAPEAKGKWNWRLVTEDREVIAASSEPVDSADEAEAAIERVRSRAREADLIEFEQAAFQVYEAGESEWRWRLIDKDGNVLADSGEEHTSRGDAAQAMITLKEQAPGAELLEIDTAAFELFVNEDDEWGWRLIDEGGQTVAEDPDLHPSRDAARDAMERLKENINVVVRRMEHAIFQTYAEDDDWHWQFVLPSGDVVASGAMAYPTRDELVDVLEDEIRGAAVDAQRFVIGTISVQIYGEDDWRWRILDRDRNVVADCSRSYEDRDAAMAMVDVVKSEADTAPIFSIEEAAIRLVSEEHADEDGVEATEWHWELIDEDRTILATGGAEPSRSELVESIEELRRMVKMAGEVDFATAAFELYTVGDGEWSWRLLDEDHHVVAQATTTYSSQDALNDVIEDIRDVIAAASILEIDEAAFELHAKDDGWIWQLVDEHGIPLVQSTRVHDSRSDAREATIAIKEHAPEGWITFSE